MQPGNPGDPGNLGAFGQQVPPQGLEGLQNLQAALVQAQQLQQQLMEAQKQITESEVTGQAGGGLVEVTINGQGKVQSVRIDPSLVDPGDVETLQDLVVAAFTSAAENLQARAKEILGPLAAAARPPQQGQ